MHVNYCITQDCKKKTGSSAQSLICIWRAKLPSNTMKYLFSIWLFGILLFPKYYTCHPPKEIDTCPIQLCYCIQQRVTCINHGKQLFYIPEVPTNTTELEFGGNFLPNITKDTLINISSIHISHLIITNSQVSWVSDDAFVGFIMLELLDLSDNLLTPDVIQVMLHGLVNCPHTTVLSKYLQLRPNPTNIVDDLENSRFYNIFMKKYNFTHILGQIFSPLKRLRVLILRGNNVYTVDMIGMPPIETLILKDNKLMKVPNFCSIYVGEPSLAPNLRELSLHNNQIQQISQSSFRCLPRLENLVLKQNCIAIIPDNTFSKLYNLRILNISLNPIKVIHRLAFNSSTLHTLTLFNKPYVRDAYQIFSEAFKYCPKLQYLDMSLNNLAFLNASNFKAMLDHLSNIRELRLQTTNLYNVMSDDIFSEMMHLKLLHLSENHLTEIKATMFSEKASIRFIDLSRNKITMINKASFPENMWKTLRYIDLAMNSFNCNCDLYWFVHWLKTTKVTIKEFPTKYICQTPNTMKGKSLLNYNPEYRECDIIPMYVIIVPCVGGFLLLIMILLILIYRYRWNIRYYIYMLRKRRNYEQLQQDENNFVFDAFVAYNHLDHEWMEENLLRILEMQEGFKLCIHDRDFEPGRYIVDNIIEKYKESRFVLLVVSNEFTTSSWCMFELKLAQTYALEEQKDSMIIILKENLDDRNLNKNLKVLMNSTTYLVWTEDERGKQIFYDKLICLLKH